MAVTRINNNQVTDAITGNTIVGLNAGTKLQAYSITATRIANNLTYGSDLTVTGNLTVQGQTTTVDTVNTLIQDPLITLADGQTSGSPTLDIGTIGLRGSQLSAVLGWKESQLGFVTALSNTTVSNTVFNISSYANLQTGNFTAQGTTSLVGNVIGTNTNFTGNITGGNFLTPGLISATSTITSSANITGANLLTGGLVSATSNITGGNILTAGNVSATGNVTGGNVIAGNAVIGNISLSGNINVVNVNASGFVSATGNVTGGNVLTGGLVSATGNVNGGNLIGAALVQGVTVSASGNLVGGNANITSAVNSTTVVASANITGGNILTGGQVSATGNITGVANITGGNVLTGGQVSATGNITGANLVVSTNIYDANAMNIVTGAGNINLSPAGNIVLNTTYINGLQLTPVQDGDAASKYYVDTIATTGITIHQAVFAATISNLAAATGGTVTYAQPNGVANGVGATLTTTGSYTFIDTANVQTVGTRILVKDQANAVQNGVYVYSNSTVITRSTDTDQYGADSTDSFSINDYFFTTNGNVNAGTAFVVTAPPGVITFGTSNIQFGVFSSSQVYTANTQAGLILNGTVFSAKVDNNTTAFDGGGNISVKAGANLTTPNIGAATGTSLSVTGTVTAASVAGGVITGTSASLSGNVTGGNLLTGGLISATSTITSGANITGANILTGGLVSATSNITGGNILTGGLISATGNISTGANSIVSGFQTVTGNVTGGNILTGGLISSTGNITSAANISGGNANITTQINTTSVSASGNIRTAGTVSATGNIDGGNVLTGGLVSATGNVTTANLILTSGFIDGPAAGRITINGSDADTDFAVDGDTLANVFYVDAGTGTASFGNSTQITNAITSFNVTSSIVIPRGNILQRPATGVTGMMRFNSTTNSLEIYNNTDWIGVGSTVFTVITDQQFNGNGVATQFTLANASTTASTIVSINGVLQIPTSAYSVANVTLTFTEAPAAGDLIDVRALTTTSTLTSIQNVSGNASIAVSDTSATTTITGDLSVTGNATVLGNVATDTILNGTTQVQIPDANQDVHFDINGVNEVFLVGQFDSRFMGNVNPQANVTYNLGNTTNRWNDLWLANSTIYMGNARISANTTSLIFTNPQGGQTVLAGSTATSSVSGNVTGGNLITGGEVVATGNISGGNLIITGNIFDSSSSLNISTTATNANIQLLPNGTGNVNIGANIMPTANATSNIGSASLSYNTIFAKATSAQYADLAEKYTADAEYVPGTVLVFGGSAEVTVNAVAGDTKVAGVVSTNPSYIMNSGLESTHVATVALTGRVPTMVMGPVRKGDLMVAAGLGRARAEADPRVGSVIGKALEDFDGAEGTIEVVVGRF